CFFSLFPARFSCRDLAGFFFASFFLSIPLVMVRLLAMVSALILNPQVNLGGLCRIPQGPAVWARDRTLNGPGSSVPRTAPKNAVRGLDISFRVTAWDSNDTARRIGPASVN